MGIWGILKIDDNAAMKAFMDLSPANADSTHRNDPYYMLQYDLCEGCGEIKPIGMIPEIDHMGKCPLNTVNYYGAGPLIGRDLVKMFYSLTGAEDQFASLKALLVYPYLKKMPDYDRATILEKKIYLLQREMEIKQMKRMRKYIELEKKLYWS